MDLSWRQFFNQCEAKSKWISFREQSRRARWTEFACRIITGTRKFDHNTPAQQELNWLPIKRHLLNRDSIMKCMKGLAPSYLSDQCNFVSATLYIIAIHETVVRFRFHYVRQKLVNVAFATELSTSATIFILIWSNLLVLVNLKEIWRVTFLPNFILFSNIWHYN